MHQVATTQGKEANFHLALVANDAQHTNEIIITVLTVSVQMLARDESTLNDSQLTARTSAATPC